MDKLVREYGDDTYFRFNALHGAEGVSLDEWKKMSEGSYIDILVLEMSGGFKADR